ncbi:MULTISPECIES: hypothetical protein [Natrialbaceae]|uniref:hypothetical protein n=1 Tax=Natrialbaceae TaxID=1644061 RepID=UPI00207C6999|nr:hypothetical protein [Natronococcus sp. CG52]
MKVRSGFGYVRPLLGPSRSTRRTKFVTSVSTLDVELCVSPLVRRLERVSKLVRDIPSLTMFVLLGLVPAGLAAPSFRQPVVLPASVIGRVEVTFRLLVYVPVAGIGAILLEPLDIGGVLGIPVLEQVVVFAALLGFCSLLSRALVRVGLIVSRRLEIGQR